MKRRNRTTNTLTAFLAVALITLTGLFGTGCGTLQTVKEEHPEFYRLGKGGAEIALTYFLGTTNEDLIAENREVLLQSVNRVFAENDDPRDVAVDLSTELQNLYPDDAATREAILRNFREVLAADTATPAARPGPESRYKAELADALADTEQAAAPAAQPEPGSAEDAGPVDMSLWGYLTSKRNREAVRAHYARESAPDDMVRDFRDLRAIERASDGDGEIDHARYRRLTGRDGGRTVGQ